MTRNTLLWTVFILTASQGLIGQFAIHGVPLFLRAEGHSATAIGLIYIAGTPYALRFLWAPLIDRYGQGRYGPYGTWIIAGQAVAFLILMSLIFTDAGASVIPIVICLAIAITATGTQQVATSAMMIQHLPANAYARAASMQAAGSTSAGMILGILVLYLLADLGWATVIIAIAALSLLLLTFVTVMVPLDRGQPSSAERTNLWAQIEIFKVPQARRLFILALMLSGGIILPYGLKSVLLIDAGFSVSEGGLIGIVFGNLVGLVAAVAVRPVVDRFGGWAVLIAIGAVGAVVAGVSAYAFWMGFQNNMIVVGLVLAASALVFAGYTANRAILMPLCKPGRLATDFASFASFEAFAILLVASFGAAALDGLGLSALLFIGAGVSVCGVLAAILMMTAPSRGVATQ
ncbi:MAG: MFS transporter [Pseudomonadota bacterium]